MKLMSTTAVAIALALGAVSVGVIAPQPAVAQKKGAPSYKLSDDVRKALAGAQEAMKKNDVAGAEAQVNAAKAAIKTEDDRFLTYNQLYEIAKAKQDLKLQAQSIDEMLQSGRVPAEAQPNFYLALGQLSYNTQDFAKAEAALDQAIKLNAGDQAAFALLAETKARNRKPAEAVALIQQAAEEGAAKGQPIPQDWIARGIAIGVEAKLPDATTGLTMHWLRNYPTQSHWRDSLLIYRDLRQLDADQTLDVMRLQRAAKALRGERDFVELAEATYLRFPNEAKTAIDEGVAAGVLDLGKSRSAKELHTLASGKVAQDKASLTKNVSNQRAAILTADAYASYADYASAIELYRKALSMGGGDANLINTRLGAALALSGQKEEAKKVLQSITGPRAELAKYWMIFIDNPPTAG